VMRAAKLYAFQFVPAAEAPAKETPKAAAP